MTTSNYMDDVKVEIAFDSGYGTTPASRTWTDVSSYVELKDGIVTSVGRSDESAAADANRLSLSLDNSDGRFTPEYAAGAYYPSIEVGRPIRVTATRPGGSDSVRFLGFVDEWPVDLSDAPHHAQAAITASSRMARMGLSATIASSIQNAFVDAAPDGLWRLADSTAPAQEENGGPTLAQDALTGSISWRGTSGPDGDSTAPLISNPGGTSMLSGEILSLTPLVIECIFKTSADDEFYPLQIRLNDSSNTFLSIGPITSSSIKAVYGVGVSTASATYAAGILDGELHHLAAVVDATSLRLYVDGVLVATQGAGVAALPTGNYLVQAGWSSGPGTSTHSISYLMLSADEAGIADRAQSSASIQSITTVSDVIEWAAGVGGVDPTELDVDTTTELITAPNTTDRIPLDVIRQGEATDGGVYFDAANGFATYRARDYRYNPTPAFTLDAGAQEIESDFGPKLDRTGLFNSVTVTGVSEASAFLRDSASVAKYGIAAMQRETLCNFEQCYQAAAWLLTISAEPSVRVASLSVDMLALSNSLRDEIAAATVGDFFTVTGLPSQAPDTSMDFFIEGWTETFAHESHRITFNTTRRDSAKWDVWTLEDATFGAYDSNPIAW